MADKSVENLRSLVKDATSVNRDRTRLTREALLLTIQDIPNRSSAAYFFAAFTNVHDALEAAIAQELPEEEIAARRISCIALLDSLATRH